MQIADLHEHRTIQVHGESLYGKLAPHDLGPARFDAPRVASRANPTETAETGDSPQEGTATHAHPLTPGMGGRAAAQTRVTVHMRRSAPTAGKSTPPRGT